MKWLRKRKPVFARTVSGVVSPYHAYLHARIGYAHRVDHSKWRNRKFYPAAMFESLVEFDRIIRSTAQ